MNFYTSAVVHRNQILLRGFDRGKRIQEKIDYRPSLFFPTTEPKGKFKSLSGDPVVRKQFPSIKDAREFIKQCGDAENSQTHGLTSFAYTFINDEYPGEVEFDPDLINVVSIDIEVDSEDGFPEPHLADKTITAITLRCRGYTYTYGYHMYQPKSNLITYYVCDSEEQMLSRFLNKWKDLDPDVVTGWYTDGFDVPYLYNRITKILGEKEANSLSPWGVVDKKDIIRGKTTNDTGNIEDRTDIVYQILGVASLDYQQLYKKFSTNKQENYKLDTVAFAELGENKLDYSKYKSLAELYKKNPHLFYEYNIHDAMLVDRLEEQCGFIQLVFSMAYSAKVNFIDTMTTVTQWDVIIYNYLWEQNIVVPPKPLNPVQATIPGGYVKDPIPGLYKWVVSLDVNSLYPTLIIQNNISPEMYRGKLDASLSIQDMLDGGLLAYNDILRSNNVGTVGNLGLYDNQTLGFFPVIMDKMYAERAAYRVKMNEAKAAYNISKNPEDKKKQSLYHNQQWSRKIFLNAGYGFQANVWSRYYDLRHAEAVTTTGQLAIQWVARDLNEYLNQLLKTNDVDYIVGSDTDSLYITLDRLVDMIMSSDSTKDEICDFINSVVKQKIEPLIDKSFRRLAKYLNVKENKLVMKREAIADIGIWTAPKHYILNVLDNEDIRLSSPDLKVVGIETNRTSTPMVARKALKECIQLIINGDQTKLHKYVREFKDKFSKMPFVDVAKPTGVNGLDKYISNTNIYKSGTPMHVRSALLYNKLLIQHNLTKTHPPIRNRDKIRLCYLKLPNTLKENVIGSPDELPIEFDLDKYIDYNTQFEVVFRNPLLKIATAIGWKIEKQGSVRAFIEEDDGS